MAAVAPLDPLVVAYELVSGLSAVPWWCWLAVTLMVVAKFLPVQQPTAPGRSGAAPESPTRVGRMTSAGS